MGKTRVVSVDREQRRAFGPLIRQARKNKGLDQSTLEEMTGISRRTIGSIERGDTVAQRDVLAKLLAVLDLKPIILDPEVKTFLTVIEPLLQEVDPDRRPRVMANLVAMLVAEIRGADQHVVVFTNSPAPVSDDSSSVELAIAAHEDGSIAGEVESTNET